MQIRITPLPTRTVTVPDYAAIAEMVRINGGFIIAADANSNALHTALHKHQIGVYAVKIGGQVVAYSIEPLRKLRK